jgi:hypothetical protein
MECKRYELIHTNTLRIGTVILIHDDMERWGELYAMTDWGNWTYRWNAVPKEGFVKFLRDADTDYIIQKLETEPTGGLPNMKGLKVRVIPAIKLAMEQTVAAQHLAGRNPPSGFTGAHNPSGEDNAGLGYIVLTP